MPKKRKVHGPEFKAKVALEAIKGLNPIHQIAREYEINPNLVSKWKKQLMSQSPQIFQHGESKAVDEDQKLKEQKLYEEIGRMKVDLDFMKKKASLFS